MDNANTAATENTMNIETAIETFCTTIQNLIATHYAESYPNLTAPIIMTTTGKRYVKVIRTETGNGSGRTVIAFVDRTTGDVFKPAGWKAPAKHARGNVFTSDLGLTQYGSVHYL